MNTLRPPRTTDTGMFTTAETPAKVESSLGSALGTSIVSWQVVSHPLAHPVSRSEGMVQESIGDFPHFFGKIVIAIRMLDTQTIRIAMQCEHRASC